MTHDWRLPAIHSTHADTDDIARRRARPRHLHVAGRRGGAVAIYERLLADDQRNADALHLLGVAHLQAGRSGEALALIDRAIFGPT